MKYSEVNKGERNSEHIGISPLTYKRVVGANLNIEKIVILSSLTKLQLLTVF